MAGCKLAGVLMQQSLAGGGGSPPPASVQVNLSSKEVVVPSVGADNFDVGDQFAWDITIENLSVSGATGVVVTDVIPAGLTFVSSTPTLGTYNSANGQWSIGNLAGGAIESLRVTVEVASGATSGQITNTANITSINETNTGTSSVSDNVNLQISSSFVPSTSLQQDDCAFIGGDVVWSAQSGTGVRGGGTLSHVAPATSNYGPLPAGQAGALTIRQGVSDPFSVTSWGITTSPTGAPTLGVNWSTNLGTVSGFIGAGTQINTPPVTTAGTLWYLYRDASGNVSLWLGDTLIYEYSTQLTGALYARISTSGSSGGVNAAQTFSSPCRFTLV